MVFSQRSVDKRISLLDAGAYGSGIVDDLHTFAYQSTVIHVGVKADHMYLVALFYDGNTHSSKLYKLHLSSMELNLMIDFVERGDVAKPYYGVGFLHGDYIYLAQSVWVSTGDEGVILRISIADNRLIKHPSRVLINGGGNKYHIAFTNGVYGFLPCFNHGSGSYCSKVFRFQLDFEGGISELDVGFQPNDGLCSGQVCYVFGASTSRLACAKQSPTPEEALD